MGTRLICIGIGYLFGLFQTSYILGRMHGIDIRNYGSGNAGTTNMMRTMGTKAGLITFAGDCLKCVAAILVVWLLFHSEHGDRMPLLKMYAAAGVILGHNFPFYLGFRGGKGVAATAGLLIGFDPLMLVLGMVVFFGIFFATHYVSLGSLLVYAGFLIELIVLGQTGHFQMTQSLLAEMYGIGIFLTAMTYWKHRKNIRRLMEGTESKTYLSSKHKK